MYNRQHVYIGAIRMFISSCLYVYCFRVNVVEFMINSLVVHLISGSLFRKFYLVWMFIRRDKASTVESFGSVCFV